MERKAQDISKAYQLIGNIIWQRGQMPFMTRHIMTEKEVTTFNKKNVYVGSSGKSYGRTYFARRDFKGGEIVMAGFGKVINHQTPHYSVQIREKKHYLPKSWTGRYWNHSCDPNTHMKTREDGFPNLVAMRSIKKGDEINYSYWMSELSWIKNADELKIKCKCKSKNCLGKIFSFSQLSSKKQRSIINKKRCAKYLFSDNFAISGIK